KTAQICLSHGFGDGGAQSAKLTQQAVQTLLYGIDIDFYIAMDMDAITTLNELVGGITVTLEEDFTAIDPTMVKGTTLTLHGMQAEHYVRGRTTVGDGTNESRMKRQAAYLTLLKNKVSGI
ncbi:MAG: LCP family protein, partial [Clostridia bacterium]